CCLPALAGFTAPCIAWGEGFNATYPYASVAGRPHERLSTPHKRVWGTTPFGVGRNRHLPV
ncbi:MAG TPA: hypothetical protein VFC86_04535, partial [Planctomycetota bacterium]|nr:hypothetical protein [Planctomycetota bacterium]